MLPWPTKRFRFILLLAVIDWRLDPQGAIGGADPRREGTAKGE